MLRVLILCIFPLVLCKAKGPCNRDDCVTGASKSRRLRDDTTQPHSGITQPHSGITQPHSGITQPHSGITQPHSGNTRDNRTQAPRGNRRDTKYSRTFLATGCPSALDTDTPWYWKDMSDSRVFADMYDYCTKNEDGEASSLERYFCCGKEANECKPEKCKLQTSWTEECDKSSFVAGLLTFFFGYFGVGLFYYENYLWGAVSLTLGLCSILMLTGGCVGQCKCSIKNVCLKCLWFFLTLTGGALTLFCLGMWGYYLVDINNEVSKPHGQPNCYFTKGSDPVGRNIAIGFAITFSLAVTIATVILIIYCRNKYICCFSIGSFKITPWDDDTVLYTTPDDDSTTSTDPTVEDDDEENKITPDDSTTTEMPTTTSTDPTVEHDDEEKTDVIQL